MEKKLKSFTLYIQSTVSLQKIDIDSIHQFDRQLQSANFDMFTIFQLICKLRKLACNHSQGPFLIFKYYNRMFQLMFLLMSSFDIDRSSKQKIIKFSVNASRSWKKLIEKLQKNIPYSDRLQLFFIKFQKSQLRYQSFKVFNYLLKAQISRHEQNHSLYAQNAIIAKMIRKKHINQSYFQNLRYFAQILEQKEDQTHFKILQVIQYAKFILIKAQITFDKRQIKLVFSHFIEVMLSLLRIVKKFYKPSIKHLTAKAKEIMLKGLQLYQTLYFKQFNIKQGLFQVQSFKRYLTGQRYKDASQQTVNETKTYVAKLTIRIMNCWKRRKQQLNRRIHVQSRQNKIRYYSVYEVQKLEKKPCTMTSEDISKSKFQLKQRMKKSHSSAIGRHLDTLNVIKIRKQIESEIDNRFKKLEYLNVNGGKNTENCYEKSKGKPDKQKRILKSRSNLLFRSLNYEESKQYRQITLEQYKRDEFLKFRQMQVKNKNILPMLLSKSKKLQL